MLTSDDFSLFWVNQAHAVQQKQMKGISTTMLVMWGYELRH